MRPSGCCNSEACSPTTQAPQAIVAANAAARSRTLPRQSSANRASKSTRGAKSWASMERPYGCKTTASSSTTATCQDAASSPRFIKQVSKQLKASWHPRSFGREMTDAWAKACILRSVRNILTTKHGNTASFWRRKCDWAHDTKCHMQNRTCGIERKAARLLWISSPAMVASECALMRCVCLDTIVLIMSSRQNAQLV